MSDFSVKDTLDGLYEHLNDRYYELLENEKPECSCCKKKCIDCSEEENPDTSETSEYDYIDDNPMTGEEILEHWICAEDYISIDPKKLNSYANIVAGFMNERYFGMDRIDDHEELQNIIDNLFDFIEYTFSL